MSIERDDETRVVERMQDGPRSHGQEHWDQCPQCVHLYRHAPG